MSEVITGLADDDIATEWRHERASVVDDDGTDDADGTDDSDGTDGADGADDADGVDPDEGPLDSGDTDGTDS
jgi:hypothetical protein